MREWQRWKKVATGRSAVRISGRIVSGGNGVYVVECAGGVRLRAETNSSYLPGQSVVVLAGRIVGLGSGGVGVRAVEG